MPDSWPESGGLSSMPSMPGIPGRRIGIAVGGLAYRSSVHVAHAASIAELTAYVMSTDSARLTAIKYQHTSNLPQGRSLWLRGLMMDRTTDYAVSVDSDTAFSASHLLGQIVYMDHGTAIGIAPVCRVAPDGRARLNIYHAAGEPFESSTCGGGHPSLWAGGFGLAVFNMRWYRRHWPEPYPEMFGEPSVDYINQGEDIQMCRSVIARGGKVIPLWAPTTHYDSTAHAVIGATRYGDGRMQIVVSV